MKKSNALMNDFIRGKAIVTQAQPKAQTANANAGNGTAAPPIPPRTMNDFIRYMGGRGYNLKGKYPR